MNTIQAQSKKLIDYLIQHLVIVLPTEAWMFILILALAPIIVGITEGILLTDWPDQHPLLGGLVPNYQPQREVIIQSISLAILLGFFGWFILFISTLRRFQQLSKLIRVVTLGISILLLIGLLWLELKVIFLSILVASYYGPMLGWPVTAGYIVIIGLVWTIGTILFMLSYFKRQFAQQLQ